MIDVAAVGELIVDFCFVGKNDQGYPLLEASPGGAPANLLAAFCTYGGTGAMIGKVGEDPFGHQMIRTLFQRGVQVEAIRIDPSVYTTLSFVTLDETGNRSFSFARKPGADACLNWQEVDRQTLDMARMVHFGSFSLTKEPCRTAVRNAISYAKTKGKWISFDPNIRLSLWPDAQTARQEIFWGLEQADVVKISEEEVDFLWHLSPEEGAERIISQYEAQLVFVTMGKNGCVGRSTLASVQVPSPSGIHTVDTVGAGDIFYGSALAYLFRQDISWPVGKETLQKMLRFACTAASLSTQSHGGIPSIVSLDEIIKLQNEVPTTKSK